MSQSSVEGIKPWVAKRILAFFNQANTWEDITQKVMNKPDRSEETQGYGIGETVAKRILSRRNQLTPRFYRSFDQLEDLEGLGQDKLEDLAYTFRLPAADEFVKEMYANLIGENWKLAHFSRTYATEEEFEEVAENPLYFREEIGDMLRQVAEDTFGDTELTSLAPLLVEGTYVDTYHTADFAQYAWALWFYQFDSDNWFSFDRVKDQINAYLSLYFWSADQIQLRLLRGFDGRGLWPAAHQTLPITVNYPERRISIWRAELFD